MSKCGKGCMPECEYFTTGGCISPFNCSYRIEELSPNSATSVSSIYVQNLISENAVLKAENAELRATISKMETVEKELRARFENAVELPCKVGDTIYSLLTSDIAEECKVKSICAKGNDIIVVDDNKGCWIFSLGDYGKTWFTDRDSLERARNFKWRNPLTNNRF